jgi:outer membrane protein assembly factor BamB
MHSLALTLLLVSFNLQRPSGPGDSVPPEDTWPQWRGPTNDSVAPGKNLPTQWTKTDNIAWKAALPGWGTSTPAVWRDAVFVTTQDEDRLLLLRLDARTGKTVWQREVGKGTPRRKGPVGNGRFHDEHNQATPSPVTDGKHVWAHFGTGDLACYDFAGEQLWLINLEKNHGPYTIWWGHGNSPILYQDLIISVCMQDPKGDGPSYIVAHEKLTGKKRWGAARMTGATAESADSYTTPLLYRNKGRIELVVFGGNVLDAYDPATGKQLWECKVFKGNRVISGPTLAGDTLFAVQGMKGPLFAVKAGGSGDVTETHVRWKYAGATPDASSPVVVNGLVYMAALSGIVVCLDSETGKELWKERLGEGFRATPLVAQGKIYFFSKEGKATVIEAGREFKLVSQTELGEEIIASPAAAGGSLFVRTKQHLYRIGK